MSHLRLLVPFALAASLASCQDIIEMPVESRMFLGTA